MFNRLLKIITVLCLTLGTFFGGTRISAEEKSGENETVVSGTISNSIPGQPIYDVTLPGELTFDLQNYKYSLSFSAGETEVNADIDSSKAANFISNNGKTIRLNPGVITLPSAGTYSVSVIINNLGDGSSEKYPLKNGADDAIEIVASQNGSKPSSSPSPSPSSEETNNNGQNDDSNTSSSPITGTYGLAIDNNKFVLSAAQGTTISEGLISTYSLAFSNTNNPLNGPFRSLSSLSVSLNSEKTQATFDVSNVGFVDKGYHAYLANINTSSQEPSLIGDYYDLGYETDQPINASDITSRVEYNRSTGTIDVVFNGTGQSAFSNCSTIYADISLEKPNGPSFYANNKGIDLEKSGDVRTGFAINRNLLETDFSRFMYGEFVAKIAIRAENTPTYTIYVQSLNIGLPPEAAPLGVITSLDPDNNQTFKYEPGTQMSVGSQVRFILTDDKNADHVYYSAITFQNNQYTFDTTTFSPLIAEAMSVRKIAIAAFENGSYVTKANQIFDPSITIKPERVIKGTCVLEPYSDKDNFKMYMICTDNDNPQDQIVVNFRDNAVYQLDVYDPNTPDTDIDAGKQVPNIELLTINKNSGINMVSFDSSNINIGNDGANPSGQPKKYAFSVSNTRNNMRVPYFYGIIKDSDGSTVLTLDNIRKNYPKVKIQSGTNGAEKGYFIECDDSDKAACDAYLTKFHDNEGPSNDPMYSQMIFTNPNNVGKGVRPMEELSDNEAEQNTVLVTDGDGHVKLFISTKILEEIGIEDGVDENGKNVGPSYTVKICQDGYPAQVIWSAYFDTDLKSSSGIKLEFVETDPVSERIILKFANGSSEPVDYFQSITNMNFNAGNIGHTSPINTGEGGNAIIAKDSKSMSILKSSIAITSGEKVTAKIYSKKYSYQVATLTLTDGFTKIAPQDLVTSVKTDGLRVYTTDSAYLNGLTELNLRETRTGGKTVIVNESSQIDRSKVSTDHYVLFKLTQNQLDLLVSKGLPDNGFWTYSESTGYITYWNHSTLSINPILFGASATQLNQSPTEVPDAAYDANLEKSDQYVTDLKNGYSVKTNIEDNMPSVDLVGAVSATVASNNDQNTLYFDEVDGVSKQAIITEKVNPLTETDVKAIMDQFEGSNYKETGTAFSISLIRDRKTISELAYPIQNNISGIKDGNYKLLSVHNGKPREIKVTVKDGKAFAYSDKFSDFVLVEDNKAAPAPAPSGDSSKKTTPTKTDNVVTCQMAGFPANYAWNEAAKACQPGYIDANGQFRVTKASKVPNTYDKGIGGSAVSLLIATIFAIGAAYMLKKY